MEDNQKNYIRRRIVNLTQSISPLIRDLVLLHTNKNNSKESNISKILFYMARYILSREGIYNTEHFTKENVEIVKEYLEEKYGKQVEKIYDQYF